MAEQEYDREREEIEEEQEMIRQAGIKTWRIVNNFEDEKGLKDGIQFK